ncbi:MAG: hypothetical protein EON93_12730 [Burkholderiales bacterium]|nr:MAG: hypothetical protein EON93_12730 [Burkholderiales bacterium]
MVVADIDGNAATEVAADIERRGGSALALAFDVSDPAAAQDCVARAVARVGRIHIPR